MGRMFSMISTKREISPARSSWLKYYCYYKRILAVSITLCCSLSPQMIAYLKYVGYIPIQSCQRIPICEGLLAIDSLGYSTLKCSLNRPNHGYDLHKQPQPPDSDQQIDLPR